MQADFNDLRFTRSDGDTLIDAWLEEKTDGVSATVWTEFPTTPIDTAEDYYYMYYGNNVVGGDWNGVDTFQFFDDFEDGSQGSWVTDDVPVDYTCGGGGSWVQCAGQYGSAGTLRELVVWNGALYGGTCGSTDGGLLLKYNSAMSQWDLAAPQLNGQDYIYDLIVYNGNIYASTRDHGSPSTGGRLFMFDEASNVWVQKAGNLGSQEAVTSICEYDGTIWGGTAHGGRLFKWNGVDAWVQMAGQYGSEIEIWRLFTSNDVLYGTSSASGLLLKWDNVSETWSQQCPQLNGQSHVGAGAWRGGTYYAGSLVNANLFSWSDGDTVWTQSAPQYGTETHIYTTIEHDGNIYGGTSPNGLLLKWDNVSAWNLAASQFGSETWICDLVVFNNEIYAGTDPSGLLMKWQQTGSGVWSGDQSMCIGSAGDSGRAHIPETHSDDVAISTWVKSTTTNRSAILHGDGDHFLYIIMSNDLLQYYSGGNIGTYSMPHGNWNKITLKNFDWASNTVDICVGADETVVYSGAAMHASTGYADVLSLIGDDLSYWDNVYIRKCVDNPATYMFGTEESQDGADMVIFIHHYNMQRRLT